MVIEGTTASESTPNHRSAVTGPTYVDVDRGGASHDNSRPSGTTVGVIDPASGEHSNSLLSGFPGLPSTPGSGPETQVSPTAIRNGNTAAAAVPQAQIPIAAAARIARKTILQRDPYKGTSSA